MRKLTVQEFIEKSKHIHGDKYDYSLVTEFKNNRSKVPIICPEHGVFEQMVKNHLSGHRCPSCSKVKKLTIDDFIKKANKIHDHKYDYSLVKFENSYSKIKIICPLHGIFEQCLIKHISGNGCPKCFGKTKLDTTSFIEKANKIHNNMYDYSLVEYVNFETKVKIICPKHGIFEQTPNKHLISKQGCPECNGGYRKTKEYFIEQSKKVHGDKYLYDLVDYKNSNTHVQIICKKHGIFTQQPKHHINGSGCPFCKKSKGENVIKNFLDIRNIKYVRQKVFEACKDKKPLPFDFYLPEYNICIEYDGEQHYKKIKYFGGNEYLELIQKHDQIKNKFCENNNIKLIRIKYNDDIEERLKNELFFHIKNI